jgi:hypothetical protein
MPGSGPERVPSEEIREEELRDIMGRARANNHPDYHLSVALMKSLPSLPILTPEMRDPFVYRAMQSSEPESVARESTLYSEEINIEELREMVERVLGRGQTSQQTVMSTGEGKLLCIYLITRDVKASVVFIKS